MSPETTTRPCPQCIPDGGRCLQAGSLDLITQQTGEVVGGLQASPDELEQTVEEVESDIIPFCVYKTQLKASTQRARARVQELREGLSKED